MTSSRMDILMSLATTHASRGTEGRQFRVAQRRQPSENDDHDSLEYASRVSADS